MKERRKHIRIKEGLEVWYAKVDEDFALSKTETEEVSACGMRLSLSELLQPGQLLRMEIGIPKHSFPIKVIAEVVWTHPEKRKTSSYITGLKFLRCHYSEAAILEQYLKEYFLKDNFKK